MAPEMAKNVPKKLSEKGISGSAVVKLVQGPLIVIKVTVKEVSLETILAKMGEEKATVKKVGGCLLSCLPPEVKRTNQTRPPARGSWPSGSDHFCGAARQVIAKVQEEALAKTVATKLAENMAPGIQAQLGEKGISVAAEGVTPALQGEYLLEHLAAMAPLNDVTTPR